MDIRAATGKELDDWAELYGLFRSYEETDDVFRERAIKWVLDPIKTARGIVDINPCEGLPSLDEIVESMDAHLRKQGGYAEIVSDSNGVPSVRVDLPPAVREINLSSLKNDSED